MRLSGGLQARPQECTGLRFALWQHQQSLPDHSKSGRYLGFGICSRRGGQGRPVILAGVIFRSADCLAGRKAPSRPESTRGRASFRRIRRPSHLAAPARVFGGIATDAKVTLHQSDSGMQIASPGALFEVSSLILAPHGAFFCACPSALRVALATRRFALPCDPFLTGAGIRGGPAASPLPQDAGQLYRLLDLRAGPQPKRRTEQSP